MKKAPIEFSRCLDLEWTEETVTRLQDYWKRRGFDFTRGDGTSLAASRGSLWWHPVAFDMRKLSASLVICPVDGRVSMTLTVRREWQVITGWNRRYFELELETCGSFLESGDLREADWAEFRKGNRKGAIIWVMTAGMCGDSPPQAPE